MRDTKGSSSTVSNGAVYSRYLNAKSAGYHAAVLEVVWPSTIPDVSALLPPVWLVTGAADGMHGQRLNIWVQQLSEISGAQNLLSPSCHALAAFNNVALPTPPTSRQGALQGTRAKQGGKWLVTQRLLAAASATRTASVATSQGYAPVYAAKGQT